MALACTLSLPSLRVGFALDDLYHRILLEGLLEGRSVGRLGLYAFTFPPETTRLMNEGVLPWFTDPELSIRFFRPLSSLLLALDHDLFGRNALAAHIHSLAWLALLVACFVTLMRRWFREPAAVLAGLVFVAAGVHAVPVAWLASRHILVAAALGVAALLALTAYREREYRPGLVLALALGASSLLASESGLAALALLAAYELGGSGGWRVRWLRSVPWLAMGVGFLVLYAALNYGPRHSGPYVSPLQDFVPFVATALWKLPVLLGELLGAVPASLTNVRPDVVPAQAAYGLFVTGVAIVAVVILRHELTAAERRRLSWLGVATLLSLLPLAAGIIDGRLLPLPLVGGAALLGNLMSALWRRFRASQAFGRWLAFGCLAGFGAAHFLVSPLLRLSTPKIYAHLAAMHHAFAQRADLGKCAQGGRIYLLTGADPTLSIYGGASLLFHTPEKARADRFRVLSVAPHDQRLSRVHANVFELDSPGLNRRTSLFEALFRASERPLRVGDTVRVEELRVEVLGLTSHLPTRLRFTFDQELERDSCLVAWNGTKLTTVDPPAIGGSVMIPHRPGPMGL